MDLNDAARWRAFENNAVTHSAAHYLMAIDTLRDEYGYARATDVAGRLEVSRGAASMAVAQLKKRKWVEEDPNRFLVLTTRGHRIAHQIKHNHRVLARLFEEVLGVSQETALADACKMEHLMSSETGRRLVWLMSHILSDDQYGQAIRDAMTRFRVGAGYNVAKDDAADKTSSPVTAAGRKGSGGRRKGSPGTISAARRKH